VERRDAAVADDGRLAPLLAARGWPSRPLVGQPLAVDLLDTRWLTGPDAFDVLDDDALTLAWLADRGLADTDTDTGPATATVRAHLRVTRDALATVVADPAAPDALNAVLDRGRLRLRVGRDGPAALADVGDPAWRAAWAAARDYVDLAERAPGRTRKCANPPCLLHFLDGSRTGDRRWCSMAVCGNRSKARRHRTRTGAS
jgi:predicted RNA-binding Zn ribbon-like protein